MPPLTPADRPPDLARPRASDRQPQGRRRTRLRRARATQPIPPEALAALRAACRQNGAAQREQFLDWVLANHT